MGQRVYTAVFENVTIAAIQDVFSMKAGAANGLEIHHVVLSAGGVTAAAEIRLRLKRFPATVTQGSGGTTATSAAVDSGDLRLASATVRVNDTAQTTSTGAVVYLAVWQWNVLGQFEHLPAPEDRETIQGGEALVLDIPAAPASTIVSGFVKWREMP